MSTLIEKEQASTRRINEAARAFIKAVRKEKVWEHAKCCSYCKDVRQAVKAVRKVLGAMR